MFSLLLSSALSMLKILILVLKRQTLKIKYPKVLVLSINSDTLLLQQEVHLVQPAKTVWKWETYRKKMGLINSDTPLPFDIPLVPFSYSLAPSKG